MDYIGSKEVMDVGNCSLCDGTIRAAAREEAVELRLEDRDARPISPLKGADQPNEAH
ncbi:hypothetical protein [Altererythrobacter litoralis]|uniref:Uncharacterized protein n=1 Tax=Altererythrobacter litoralis TaxID=3113904 RepID=A0ABU7GDJ8_9SPHN|nr:hypothetical protein [Erythrobacteraceae bacterium 1XM1-14]